MCWMKADEEWDPCLAPSAPSISHHVDVLGWYWTKGRIYYFSSALNKVQSCKIPEFLWHDPSFLTRPTMPDIIQPRLPLQPPHSHPHCLVSSPFWPSMLLSTYPTPPPTWEPLYMLFPLPRIFFPALTPPCLPSSDTFPVNINGDIHSSGVSVNIIPQRSSWHSGLG